MRKLFDKKLPIFVVLILLLILSRLLLTPFQKVNAIVIDSTLGEVYKVYSEEGVHLLDREDVLVGDEFLTKDFNKYRIISKNENHVAIAKWLEKVEKPEIDFGFSSRPISAEKPVIALYMTHNDESYVPTDNVDSVYGAGGIHDVATALKNNLENQGITTYLDETLHIPHDTSAYSRSGKTAKSMIEKYSPDCIFDIHRDGASRKTYVKWADGKERCKVRIVVGKASKNYESAEQLALYLLAVGEEICDWLFLDIYYATGHYNQGLHNKALLFEMGSHLVEKELAIETTSALANVINVAFFNTTVDKESGDVTVFGDVTESTPTINQMFETKQSNSNSFVSGLIIFVVTGMAGVITWVVLEYTTKKRKGSR